MANGGEIRKTLKTDLGTGGVWPDRGVTKATP